MSNTLEVHLPSELEDTQRHYLKRCAMVADAHGYVATYRGRVGRTLHVVFCPWNEGPTSAKRLIKELCKALSCHEPSTAYPERLPHRRMRWSLHVRRTRDYIDAHVFNQRGKE